MSATAEAYRGSLFDTCTDTSTHTHKQTHPNTQGTSRLASARTVIRSLAARGCLAVCRCVCASEINGTSVCVSARARCDWSMRVSECACIATLLCAFFSTQHMSCVHRAPCPGLKSQNKKNKKSLQTLLHTHTYLPHTLLKKFAPELLLFTPLYHKQ